MTEDEELQLIRRVVDGEINAFEQLFLHYHDRLLRMIATLLNDERRLAEDLSYAEAAQIETTTVGTMKSRVSRARDFLKSSLEQN